MEDIAEVKHDEDKLQKATAAFLDRLGWLAFHVPNERRNKAEAVKLSTRGVMSGVSDWIILEPWAEDDMRYGFGVVIELKSATGRPTQAQLGFMEAAEHRGMRAFVVRSLDEFKDAIRCVRPLNGRRVK